MKTRLVSVLVFAFAVGVAAQDATPTTSGMTPSAQGPNQAGRGGRGGWGGVMGMGGGRGVMGTVTDVTTDHYTIKTETGESFTIRFSVNTRILKQTAVSGRGQAGQDMRMGANPPQAIKSTDIKVGDVISAMGEMDATTKSIGALFVMQMDPERAKQMLEMQANFGKTWLMGKVTTISDLTVTIQSGVDQAAHTFTADENTTFRKRRDPITLADIQVGDNVRVEGAVRNGVFLATAVAVMGMPAAGTPTVPRPSIASPDK
jgi:preprotein translocase subunit YajC